jgi:hypothetical protein
VFVLGRISVSADAGAQAVFGGEFTGIEFQCGRGRCVFSHAELGQLALFVSDDLEIEDCHAGFLKVWGTDATSVAISRCTVGASEFHVAQDVTLTDTSFDSVLAELGGSFAMHGASSSKFLSAAAFGDVLVDDGVSIVGNWLFAESARGRVALGTGIDVDARPIDGWLQLRGWAGVELAGSYRFVGADIASAAGDVLFRDGCVVTAGAEPMTIHAEGAIATSGGSMDLTAGSFSIRSVTGDLDLDVHSMTASSGRLVVLSNGEVRLRGTYLSAGDVQILSRRDSIDVTGATLATADAGAAPSAFVRLATYASTASISANGATLATGSSDTMSGDVLLQIAESGGETTTGVLKAGTARLRRSGDGVVTRIRGTVRYPRAGMAFYGSNRLDVGARSRHVFLHRRRTRAMGSGDGADLVVRTTSPHRASFVLTLRDGGGEEGEVVPLSLVRAGFRAQGSFRRPHVR